MLLIDSPLQRQKVEFFDIHHMNDIEIFQDIIIIIAIFRYQYYGASGSNVLTVSQHFFKNVGMVNID